MIAMTHSRSSNIVIITLLVFLAGCATAPQTVISPTNVTVQSPLPFAVPTRVPLPTFQATSTTAPIIVPSRQPIAPIQPTLVPQATLVPLVTPAMPLNQAIHQYTGDALLYTRPDRFLMLTDPSAHQPLWLTAGICNLENGSTEQGGEWSVDGRYLAVTCNQAPNSDLIQTSILDTFTGKVQPIPLQDATSDSWSPVHPQVLIRQFNGDGVDWYVVNARTQKITQLVKGSDQNAAAAWSPDGMHIAITGYRMGQLDAVTLLDNNGSHVRQLSVADDRSATGLLGPISWSSDGTFLLLNRQRNPSPHIYTYQALRLDVGTGQSQILVDSSLAVLEFHWSPDGAWFVMGQPGQPSSHLGRWSLYDADGTLLHAISTNSQRDDIAIRWLPNSQLFVIMAVRLNVGVEIITSDLQSNETVIARYPNNGPGFPALAIAPSGAFLAVYLSGQGITILNVAGQEQALMSGRINAWRPKR